MPETSYYGGIHSITKDSIGRMWYSGHETLFMYNGNSFYQMNQQITKNPPRSFWSYGHVITDKARRLYVATNNGLLKFNYQKQDFECILKGNIGSVVAGDDGSVWLIRDSRVESFYAGQLPAVVCYPLPASIPALELVNVNDNVYISSTMGRVYKLDKKTKRYNLFVDLGDDSNMMKDIVEYNGSVYILTHMKGIYECDMMGKVLNHYDLSSNTKKTILSKEMYLDPSNIIWIATQSGLSFLDPETGKISQLQFNLNNRYSLPNNSVWAIFPDPDGGVWIGTYGGKLAYMTFFDHGVNYIKATPGGLDHPIVSCFEEDNNGNLWIGTEGGGLNYWNRKNDEFTHYTQEKNSGINSNMVKKLHLDYKRNILQISAYNGGMQEYDSKSRQFTDLRMYYPGTSKLLNIYDFALEADSGIWVTDPDFELMYKNKRNGKVEVVSLLDSEAKAVKMQIETLFRDTGNKLWLITHKGLYIVDVRSRRILNHYYIDDAPFSINNLCSYCITSNSEIWLGTRGGGVNLLKKNGEYINWTKNNQLEGKTIFGILEDTASKDIWFSTNDGLYYYDNKLNEIIKARINVPNLCGAFYLRSCYKTSKGEMLFGGTNGFIMFTPAEIKYNNQKPHVFFTDLLINNNKVIPGTKDSPLEKDISVLNYSQDNNNKIVLSHKQSNIEIRFSSNSYLQTDKNQYVYKMSGLSEEWYILPQGQKSVQFFNLPAGKYIFQIKAANNDGVWGDDIASLYFVVKPSPFFSVWAYIIYSVLILSLVYLIWRYFTNKKIFKHRLEIEKVKEQNMRKLTQARINFFTNISHDLKTPLTLVVDPLKQLKELLPDNESSRTYIHLIEKNVKRIQRMISQLLQFREIESQKITLNMQSDDLIKYIDNIFSLFDLYANKKGIETDINCQIESFYTDFDHDVIEKIFTNLFSNAMKYTPDNGYVGVKIYRSTDEEISNLNLTSDITTYTKYISVVVTNTGTEIPEDKKQMIFESFRRLASNRPVFEESTGLGLAIVKELVGVINGNVTLHSEDSKVSFSVILPFVQEREQVESNVVSYDYTISEIDNILTEPDEVNLHNKQSRKANDIVIIEDDTNLRNYIEQRLSEYYNVYTAVNGNEGIAKVEKVYPQIVITDLMMPKADGFEVCRSLRSNFKTSHIPVIVLSGLGKDTQNKIKALEYGANVFIDKPFDMDYLLKQVDNLIKNQNELKQLYSKKFIAEPSKITISSMDEELLKKAMMYIEQNIDNTDYDVESFVSDMGIGRTLLYQKINDIVGLSIKEFIMDIRLKRGAQLLRESDLTISEIADKIGFVNAKYFSICFKKHFEVTPSEFKKKP